MPVDEQEEGAAQLTHRGYDDQTKGVVRLSAFIEYWREETEPWDECDRFFRLLSKMEALSKGPRAGSRGVEPVDFMPYLEELLAFHPGLAFLESTPEFQEKYARTVVARVYYHLDPMATQVLGPRQMRISKPSLTRAFHTVDMEEDINVVTQFFSYEHFYVLYCKFWELDGNHDFLLSREDLSKMQNLTHSVLDRVFQGAGRPSVSLTQGHMCYEDFVCFLLSEEDKTSEESLRYWFRVVDLDGDGRITKSEMAHFYREQTVLMQELGMEPIKLDDVVTQMTDLLNPTQPGIFRLADFLHPSRVKLTGVLFSALFNLNKLQTFEQRDPMVVK